MRAVQFKPQLALRVVNQSNWRVRGFACLVFLLTITARLFVGLAPSSAQTLPTLPQATVDTSYPTINGTSKTVGTGKDYSDLQTAVNAAAGWDPNLNHELVLTAGETFTGPFTLPRRSAGAGWIIIRSSAVANLPTSGTRVAPADAANMPRIIAPVGQSAVVTNSNPGSRNYRLVGLEIAPAAGQFVYELVSIGTNVETATSQLPTDIIIDRSYIHGDPSVGGRRGVALHGVSSAVIDSYLADFKESGSDAQAIWGNNGPGPYLISNNRLEGSGENVFFGGAPTANTGVIPSDITFVRNHVIKPAAWENLAWTIKNLFEVKNGRRILVEGNVFENCWYKAQQGPAFVLTPRNQSYGVPQAVVQDVTIRYNRIRNVWLGGSIQSTDDLAPSGTTERIYFHNNIWEDIGTNSGGGGRLFFLMNQPTVGILNFLFRHNTVVKNSGIGYSGESTASAARHAGFQMVDNLMERGQHGFAGNGTGDGNQTLNTFYISPQATSNVFIAGISADWNQYPGNFFPANVAAVQFVDYANDDYHLASGSPYKNAGTDGKDLGADIDVVNAAIAGLIPGTPVGSGTPTSLNSSGDGGGGGCFIATVAYGSPLAPQVVVLRKFRDRHLLPNRVGVVFVKWYYRISPSLAVRIQQSPALTMLVWTLLWPVVGVAWLVLNPGLTLAVLAGCGGLVGWVWRRRRMRCDRQRISFLLR